MKRNDESYYVLLALGLWRFMGNRSWDFPGSEEYTLILINYLNKHREKILDTVRYPAIDNLEYWDYESWALLNEFYIRILNGELDFNYLLEDVYRKIFNTELNIDITRSYGEIWTSMRERLEKDRDIDTHHNQTIRYYNLILGETNPELTPVYFLDAYEILANLEELKRKDWTLDEQIGLFLEIQRGSTHYTPLNILKKYYVNRLDKLVEEGMAKLDLISGKLKDIFGQDYNEDNIDELNRMGKKFLEETLFSVNENYDPLLLATLTDSKNSGKAIMGFVGDMERIKELGNIHKLMKLSRLDVYDISLYLQVLTNLENKVGNVNNRFRSRLEGENIEEIDKIEETERNINKMIQDMKERILSEIEVSSHVGG